MIALRGLVLLAVLGAAACATSAPAPPQPTHGPTLSFGAAVGEVSAGTAVVWCRCDCATTLHVQRDGAAAPLSARVGHEHDFTGVVVLEGLQPSTSYSYRAWCGDELETAVHGWFRTPPAQGYAAPVRFIWSGDLGGQNICRDAAVGYFIFDRLRARDPDFFVALGDMIYADDTCDAIGRCGNRQIPGP